MQDLILYPGVSYAVCQQWFSSQVSSNIVAGIRISLPPFSFLCSFFVKQGNMMFPFLDDEIRKEMQPVFSIQCCLEVVESVKYGG